MVDLCECGLPIVRLTSKTKRNNYRAFMMRINRNKVGGFDFLVWADHNCTKCEQIIPKLETKLRQQDELILHLTQQLELKNADLAEIVENFGKMEKEMIEKDINVRLQDQELKWQDGVVRVKDTKIVSLKGVVKKL